MKPQTLAGPIAAALLLLAATSVRAQSVTLAWDPNPEPEAVGYLVFVGTVSGAYTETYDVGNQTSFVYTRAVHGQSYYFLVAAYAAGHVVGQRSDEIVGFADAEPWLATPPSSAAQSGTACVDGTADCYGVTLVARGLGPITAMAATGDGRLLVIEDSRRVRVIAGDALLPEAAFTLEDDETRLTSIAADPAFSRTRFVFLGTTRVRGDGTRELTIIRYRELQDGLGEGAAIVSSLPLSSSGDAPFTLDADGRIYVAMPASSALGSRSRDPYEGSILRFGADGTVPRDNPRASPVLARGYRHPSGIEWDATTGRLWLAGQDPQWSGSLAHVDAHATGAEWPAPPHATRVDGLASPAAGTAAIAVTSGSRSIAPMIFTTDADNHLVRAHLPGGELALRFRTVALDDAYGQPVSVASGHQGTAFVAVRSPATLGGPESMTILKLQPR